ncbi:MAG: hypothetical protein H7842_02485 [Gammaproteobacteria bacterium SHHR-1]
MKVTIEIGCREVELYVDYRITGRYRTATHTDPEEFPELEVASVTHQGQELPDWLNDLLADSIESACWNDAENKKHDDE